MRLEALGMILLRSAESDAQAYLLKRSGLALLCGGQS
jgi:hypothetical protein